MAIVSFSQRLADHAAAAPAAPAVTCGERSVTRAELEIAADALARQLLADGVKLGDLVTIALPNSVDWFVAVVATWKIGAIPQPVSARLPARELAAIVELADPPVVLGADADVFRRSHLSTGGLCRPDGRPGRRAVARCDLAGMEGADLRRLHRPAKAHRRGPTRKHR